MYTTLIIIFHFHPKLICLPRNRVINNFGIHLKMCSRNIYLVLKYVCSCLKDVCNGLLDFLLRSKDITSKSLLITFSQHNIHIFVMNEIQALSGLLNISISVYFGKNKKVILHHIEYCSIQKEIL